MNTNNYTLVIQQNKVIELIVHEKGALFMVDDTQAVGKIGIDVDAMFSGQKIL